MKRLVVLFVTAVVLTTVTANTVAAQPPHAKAYGKQKFYYYPDYNVYYDAGPGMYYYNPGPSWSGVTVLPANVNFVTSAPRYVVYHNGPEVWQDNKIHVVKYKAYKNKPAKYKKGKGHGKH
jgi:hypothetical protein